MPVRRTRPNPTGPWASLPPKRRAIGIIAVVAVLFVTAAVIGNAHDSAGRGGAQNASTKGASGGGLVSKAAGGASVSKSAAPTVAPSRAGGLAGSTGADAATSRVAPATGTDTKQRAPQAGGGSVQAKIIRTGSVEVEVTKGRFATAVARLTDLASGVGGFVSASETSQLGDDPRGSVTLRVPAKDFDRVLARIATLGKIRSVTTGSQDVTGEYTDVASRIKALEAEREQIGLVLGRAQSIPDILSVRDRLSAVQGELEQLQGRKQVLDDQASLSTLKVSVSEKGAKPAPLIRPDPDRRGLASVWHDSADRFGDGARAIAVGFAAMAPWLLLLAVLWLPTRWLWRRSQTAVAPVPSSPPPATTAD
ncbi:MAG: DUF4349 domain-containing protein [Acidimicrobiales bacterium]